MHAYKSIPTLAYTYSCPQTHTTIHISTQIYVHIYTHTFLHTYPYTCTHTHIHVHIPTCIYTRTCIYKQVHTYLHTHKQRDIYKNMNILPAYWPWFDTPALQIHFKIILVYTWIVTHTYTHTHRHTIIKAYINLILYYCTNSLIIYILQSQSNISAQETLNQ